MLYHIDVDIDYVALGDAREAILKAEWARTQELIKMGVAIGEWRKASGRGVIATWDCVSPTTGRTNFCASSPLRPISPKSR